MATTVLVGFSCAGKSTLACCARKRWPELRVLDSDEWLARDIPDARGETHIHNLFVEFGRSAIDEVAKRERAFLAQQYRSANPVLIAAGPALVSRDPEWQQFVDRVKPSFIYLTQSAEQAATGLRERRTSQINSDLARRPNFGSWDEDVLTARGGDRWVDVAPEQVLLNVRRHMRQLVEIYEQLAPSDRVSIDEARTDTGRERVLARIAESLGFTG